MSYDRGTGRAVSAVWMHVRVGQAPSAGQTRHSSHLRRQRQRRRVQDGNSTKHQGLHDWNSRKLDGKYSLESTDPRESEIRAHLRL